MKALSNSLYRTICKKKHVFIYSILACLLAATVYVLISKPKYAVSIVIPVNRIDLPDSDLLELINAKWEAPVSKKQQQLKQITSAALLSKVIQDQHLHVNYFKDQFFGKESFGNSSPVNVSVYKNDGNKNKQFKINLTGNNKFILESDTQTWPYTFGEYIEEPGLEFTVNKTAAFNSFEKIVVKISPLSEVVNYYTSSIALKPITNDTSRVKLTITDNNPQPAYRLLAALSKRYTGAEPDKIFAQTTLKLINVQLDSINRLLSKNDIPAGAEEKSMVNAKNTVPASDLALYKKQRIILQTIRSYVNVPKDEFSIVPNTFEVQNPVLLSLINRLNVSRIVEQKFMDGDAGNLAMLNKAKENSNRLKDLTLFEIARQRTKIDELLSGGPVLATRKEIDVTKNDRQLLTQRYTYLFKKRNELNAALVSKPVTTAPIITGLKKRNAVQVFMGAILAGLLIPLPYILINRNRSASINTK